MNNNNFIIRLLLSSITFCILWLMRGYNIYSSFGIAYLFFFALSFFEMLGSRIDIRSIVIIIAGLQWVVGPFLAFHYKDDDPIFYMTVDENTYMAFTSPALFFMAVGLHLPIFKQVDQRDVLLTQVKSFLKLYPNLDILLLLTGIFVNYFTFIVPGSLMFVIFLLGFLRYIGIFLMLTRNRKGKVLWTSLLLISELSTSVAVGAFHDLLLWLSFLLIIIAFIYEFSFLTKAIVLAAVVVFIFLIQAVKYEIRSITNEGRSLDKFTEIITNKASDSEFLTSDVFLNTWINRLNQGWIIARIIKYVPEQEPYAGGETIITAIKESVLIGAFAKKTTKAGISSYFQRFTGVKLAYGTSMDISTVGEAYANFGSTGGILFMFIWGFFYNWYYHKVLQISQTYPLLMLFMPLLFLHAIKAETDIASTLNYMIKSSLLVFGIFTGLNFVINMKAPKSQEDE